MEKNKLVQIDDNRRAAIGKGSLGWYFSVYYGGMGYANFVSASYKTKREIIKQLNRYLQTGQFDFYGSAEYAKH